MKIFWRGLITVCLLFAVVAPVGGGDEFPILRGSYLDQTPPGMEPEVFAPGILNTKTMGAFCTVFSPDGGEFYFVYYERGVKDSGGLAWMRRVNNVWTRPEMLHFNSPESENDMCISADGGKLIFRSWRALPDGRKPENHSYLWFVERTGKIWGDAKPLLCSGEPVRTGYPSLSRDNTLYFVHRRDGRLGVYRSKCTDGVYGTPEFVYTLFNNDFIHGDMFVAPDENYMIVSGRDPQGKIGRDRLDLYVVFRNLDGSWSKPVNMGDDINTEAGGENCPQVSPDGKYFFFNRYNPDVKMGNMIWVDAKILDRLRPGARGKAGGYLDQELPGREPVYFAPGVVTSRYHEHSAPALSPDGKWIFWSVFLGPLQSNAPQVILFCQLTGEGWTPPAVASFSGRYMDGGPVFSPDGDKIYFGSCRPIEEKGKPKDWDIWYVEKLGDGWGKPVNVGAPVNTTKDEGQPTITRDGTLYFISQHSGYKYNLCISRSRLVDGRYAAPEVLGDPINVKGTYAWCPFIASDESYLLFTSEREGGLGRGDIYISRRLRNGTWAEPRNLGAPICSPNDDRFPGVSPDGEILFFTSRRQTFSDHYSKPQSLDGLLTRYLKPGNGLEDIFWIDAMIIDELRRNK